MKEGFVPIISPTSRILILGTVPSEESLKRQEYYGNPRNQFWRIMQELYAISVDDRYTMRIAGLAQNQLALWDVLKSCERVGSLDSAIRNAVPNDFKELFTSYPELKLIAFNGKKAAEWFGRRVIDRPAGVQTVTLPSTSPAAAMAFEKKAMAWAILKYTLTNRLKDNSEDATARS